MLLQVGRKNLSLMAPLLNMNTNITLLELMNELKEVTNQLSQLVVLLHKNNLGMGLLVKSPRPNYQSCTSCKLIFLNCSLNLIFLPSFRVNFVLIWAAAPHRLRQHIRHHLLQYEYLRLWQYLCLWHHHLDYEHEY